jgi:putative ABC transport system permease protein
MEWKITALAQKNLRRKVFRSLAIIAAVMESVEQSRERGTARLGADIMVVPDKAETAARTALLTGKPSAFYMDKALVDKISKIRGVRGVTSQIFLKTSPYACCDVSDLFLVGFDPDNDFTIKPWLTNNLGRPLAADEVIMGRGITAYTVGFTLTFFNQPFKVVGMLEETGMEFIDNSIFISYAGIDRILNNANKEGGSVPILPNQVSTVLVQVDPELNPDRVSLFIQAEVDGVKAIVTDRIIASVRKQLFILLKSVLSVSAIIWVMALLLVGVVFSMIVNERRRELGIFRAMGAKKSHLFRLIMVEAAILSFLGGVIGIGLGGGVLFLFKDAIYTSLNIPHLWPNTMRFVGLVGFCMLLSLLTGIIAALGPAIRASMLEPYAAIRGGE